MKANIRTQLCYTSLGSYTKQKTSGTAKYTSKEKMKTIWLYLIRHHGQVLSKQRTRDLKEEREGLHLTAAGKELKSLTFL